MLLVAVVVKYTHHMKNELPVVYEYIDFRKYLEDYRKIRTGQDAGFTHYYICYRLGMKNSRSYFNNIVRGRKNVSPETVEKLVELLELPTAQANYFRALVNYNQTRHAGEKKYYFDQIISLNNTPRKIIDNETYSYFTTWYLPVIRELLETVDVNENYKDLAAKTDPPITLRQVKEAIALLLKLGLIDKNSDGYYKPNGKVVSTSDSVQNHLIDQYQILSLSRAQDKIAHNRTGHKTTTMTLSVSREGLEHILEQMAKFRSAVRSIAHKDEQENKKVYEVILNIHKQST